MSGGHARHHGFSMIEAVICILLIGIALVAAMRTVGASAKAQTITQRRAVGAMLAQDLMAEIMSKAYEEPDGLTVLLADVGDVPGDRSTFDDVDDFDGWAAMPPKAADNTVLTDYSDWTRKVEVDMVTASNPDIDPLLVIGDTDVKRVVVKVYHGDFLAYEMRALKTAAWATGGGTE